jgi:hypothetical protein
VPRASAIRAVAAATSRLMRVARPKSALVRNAPNHRNEMRVGGKARLGASLSDTTATTRMGRRRKR